MGGGESKPVYRPPPPRIPTPPPAPKPTMLPEPWRPIPPWNVAERDKLFQEITQFKPPIIESTKVLMIGQVGAGKSSLFNTLASIFYGHIVEVASAGGSASESVTLKYKEYPVRSKAANTKLNFKVCDTQGLETDYGFHDVEFEYLLEGNVPNGHDFNRTASMTPSTHGFIKDPPLASKAHCVCFVFDATTVMIIEDALLARFRYFVKRLRARDDTPHVVILTKIDLLDPEVRADTSKVYRSIKVKEVIDKVADILSIPKSLIVPLRNYESENELNTQIDILALLGLRQILRATETFLYTYDD